MYKRQLYSRSGCFMCDKTDYDNIFKGIIRCADCGRTMLVKVEHRRKRNSVLAVSYTHLDVYKRQHAGRRAGRKLPVLLLYPTTTPAMVAGVMEAPA